MSAFQTYLKSEYTKKGYKVLVTINFGEKGFPDLLLMKDGRCKWIESKEANDDLKPLQKLRIDELNANGCKACCIQKGKGIIYPKNMTYEQFEN